MKLAASKGDDYKGPIVVSISDKDINNQQKEKKFNVSNLPYLHKHPAV